MTNLMKRVPLREKEKKNNKKRQKRKFHLLLFMENKGKEIKEELGVAGIWGFTIRRLVD